MNPYWSDTVRRLDPYIPGEQPQDQQYIKLNTNESPYPPSPAVAQVIQHYDTDSLRRYPDPESNDLRRVLASYHGLSMDQVFIGNGSDEVLAHAFQAFFKQSKPLLFPDISYSFYPVYCALYDIDFVKVALDGDLTINIDHYSRASGGIILPNPNAPTGIAMPLDRIRALLDKTDAVVLIDEAYVDFGTDSADALINEYDNLLVVQTFSKSRSLAGLRLGYALGHSELIEALNRVKNSFNSYPIDQIASAAAIASVQDQRYFEDCSRRVIENRDRLSKDLELLGFHIYPSSSNFVFVEHRSRAASELYTELKQAGILVRYFNAARIDNCLRISIGSEQECQALVEALKAILAT